MASGALTPAAARRRYIEASAASRISDREARRAHQGTMRELERKHPGIREHAMAAANADVDEPLPRVLQDEQRRMRKREGFEQADVQRTRRQMRQRHQAPRRRAPAPEPPRRRVPQLAPIPSPAPALKAATGGGGSTLMYAIGIGLLLCLVYLLVAGRGTQILPGVFAAATGAVGSFISPSRDPIADVEKAFGATPIAAAATSPSGGGGGAAASSGLPGAAKKKLQQISKALGWSESAWLAVIGKESGGNPAATNKETGAYGIGQLNPENASNPRAPRAGSTASKYPKYKGNAIEQIEAMAEYIRDAYGNPTNALHSEETRGWY